MLCTTCLYDVSGIAFMEQCPECGTPGTRKSFQQSWRSLDRTQ